MQQALYALSYLTIVQELFFLYLCFFSCRFVCSACCLLLVLGQALYTFSLWLIPFRIVRTDYVYGGGTVAAEDDKAKMAGGGQGLWSLHTFPPKAASKVVLPNFAESVKTYSFPRIYRSPKKERSRGNGTEPQNFNYSFELQMQRSQSLTNLQNREITVILYQCQERQWADLHERAGVM